jgi:hypothetical protein
MSMSVSGLECDCEQKREHEREYEVGKNDNRETPTNLISTHVIPIFILELASLPSPSPLSCCEDI